jgi:hypothetical protein
MARLAVFPGNDGVLEAARLAEKEDFPLVGIRRFGGLICGWGGGAGGH